MERDSGFEEGVPPGAGGVGDRGEIRLVEPPVGVRPVREHGARVRPVARDDFPARRAGDALDARLPEFCALLVKDPRAPLRIAEDVLGGFLGAQPLTPVEVEALWPLWL